MKYFLVALLALLCMTSSAHAVNIGLFGDSISAGLLENRSALPDGWVLYPTSADKTDNNNTISSVMVGNELMHYDTKSSSACGAAHMYQCIENVAADHPLDYLVFMLAINDISSLMTDEDHKTYYGQGVTSDVDAYITKFLAFVSLLKSDFPETQIIVAYYYPPTTTVYGAIDAVETACTDDTTCIAALNKNVSYLIQTITPQLTDIGVPVVDVHDYLTASYSYTDRWISENSTDGIHIKASSAVKWFDLFFSRLQIIIDNYEVRVQ